MMWDDNDRNRRQRWFKANIACDIDTWPISTCGACWNRMIDKLDYYRRKDEAAAERRETLDTNSKAAYARTV